MPLCLNFLRLWNTALRTVACSMCHTPRQWFAKTEAKNLRYLQGLLKLEVAESGFSPSSDTPPPFPSVGFSVLCIQLCEGGAIIGPALCYHPTFL